MVGNKLEFEVDTTFNFQKLRQELRMVEEMFKNSLDKNYNKGMGKGDLDAKGAPTPENLYKRMWGIVGAMVKERENPTYTYDERRDMNIANRNASMAGKRMADERRDMAYNNDNEVRRWKAIDDRILAQAKATNEKLRAIKAEEEAKTYAQQEFRANAMLTKFKRMQRAKLDEVRRVENDIRKKATDTSRKIRESFETAFSIHILRTFITPFMASLNRFVQDTIQNFAEFDKAYADYIAKSQDFAQVASRQDLFGLAAGEAFSVTNVAQAMERFAASGLDVSRNQKAVVDALQIATVAEVDFKDAANSVIKTMEAFNLSLNDSGRIVDVMTNAANASTAELQDLIKWFEFTSGAANVSGLSIEQLSATLGVLASTGLPNVGTAFRQFLLQFQKADIREKFSEKFGFEEADYRNMYSVIETMRDYVTGSSDQAKAVEELTQLLGGKANAQLALNNILRATPDLWNRLNEVVYRAGSASELYELATDNAAHSLDRIRNSIELVSAQIGYALNPALKAVASIMEQVTDWITNMPKGLRMVIGAVTVLSGILASLGLAFVTVISFMAVLYGITMRLEAGIEQETFSVAKATDIFKRFRVAVAASTGEMANSITVFQKHTATVLGSTQGMGLNAIAARSLKDNIVQLSRSVYLTIGIFTGMMVATSLAENKAYDLANAVWTVVAAFSALKVAGMVAGLSIFGPAGAFAGMGVLAGSLAGSAVGVGVAGYGYNQVHKTKASSYAVNPGTYTTQNTTNNYIMNVDGIEVQDSEDARNMVRFISEELA